MPLAIRFSWCTTVTDILPFFKWFGQKGPDVLVQLPGQLRPLSLQPYLWSLLPWLEFLFWSTISKWCFWIILSKNAFLLQTMILFSIWVLLFFVGKINYIRVCWNHPRCYISCVVSSVDEFFFWCSHGVWEKWTEKIFQSKSPQTKYMHLHGITKMLPFFLIMPVYLGVWNV